MSMSTGNFGELLEPGLRVIWGDRQKQWEPEYSKVFDIRNSSKATEHTLSLAGFGVMPTKNQGQSVSYDDAKQGNKHSLTHVTYGLGCIITKEMYEDDLYDRINKMPKLLSLAGERRVETNAANILNNAFTAAYTGGDGKELCATDHPLEKGGTGRNELSTAADLSMTSFEQALIDIGDYVDGAGQKMKAMSKRLIIPTSLEWTARQLLGSDKDPETANNAINPAKGMMPYVVMHYLTDPDAWFIQTDVPDGLLFYWRRKPEFTRDSDHDTDNAKFKETMRFICGWDDWRNIFGSPGV